MKKLLSVLRDPEFATDFFLVSVGLGQVNAAVQTLQEAGYQFVEVIKDRVSPTAADKPSHWNQYRMGVSNNLSLPLGYKVRGILLQPPKVGGNVKVLRISRNGVVAAGIYESTAVIHTE